MACRLGNLCELSQDIGHGKASVGQRSRGQGQESAYGGVWGDPGELPSMSCDL